MQYLDYEDYLIYDTGDVFSLKSYRFLKQYIDDRGYQQINLRKNNKGKTIRIHRLVSTCFLKNPNNLPMVEHIDADKLNNDVSNLKWSTYGKNKCNLNDKLMKNNTSGYRGVRYDKQTRKWIAQLTKKGKNYSKVFNTIEEAIAYRQQLEIKYFSDY